MYHERARTLQGVLLTLDAICICAAFGIAILLRVFHESLPLLQLIPSIPWASQTFIRSDYGVLFAANLITWVVYLRRSGLYLSGDAERADRVLLVYTRALLLSILATSAASFAFKVEVSRLLFAYFYGAEFVLLLAKQFVFATVVRRIRRDELHRRHALVIGARSPGTWFCDIVAGAKATGYALVGLLLTEKGSVATGGDSRILGNVEELDRVLHDHPVNEVFIVGSARELAETAPLAQYLIEKGRIVSLVSTLSGGDHGVSGRVTHFNGVPMISFGPMPEDELHSGAKRFFDVAVSGAALVVLSPLMLAVAAAIKLFDPGPVFFRQERLGVDRRPFMLYKFRSMRVDAEKLLAADPELHRRYVENDFKLPDREDPRVSALGRFLRKSSLDELPQLWNVLKGEMTLVGPRPIVPKEVARYEPYVDLLLSVPPGLTGQWQVSGRSEVRYPERAFLDLDYVGRHSVAHDLSIVLRTVPAVIRRRGVS